jgi:hypothetical protein
MTIFTIAQATDATNGEKPVVMIPDADIFFQEDNTFELTEGGKVITMLPLDDHEYAENGEEIPVVFRGFEIPAGRYGDGESRQLWGGAYTPRSIFLLIPEQSELGRALVSRGLVQASIRRVFTGAQAAGTWAEFIDDSEAVFIPEDTFTVRSDGSSRAVTSALGR